jgi:hypothetical protein
VPQDVDADRCALRDVPRPHIAPKLLDVRPKCFGGPSALFGGNVQPDVECSVNSRGSARNAPLRRPQPNSAPVACKSRSRARHELPHFQHALLLALFAAIKIAGGIGLLSYATIGTGGRVWPRFVAAAGLCLIFALRS